MILKKYFFWEALWLVQPVAAEPDIVMMFCSTWLLNHWCGTCKVIGSQCAVIVHYVLLLRSHKNTYPYLPGQNSVFCKENTRNRDAVEHPQRSSCSLRETRRRFVHKSQVKGHMASTVISVHLLEAELLRNQNLLFFNVSYVSFVSAYRIFTNPYKYFIVNVNRCVADIPSMLIIRTMSHRKFCFNQHVAMTMIVSAALCFIVPKDQESVCSFEGLSLIAENIFSAFLAGRPLKFGISCE